MKALKFQLLCQILAQKITAGSSLSFDVFCEKKHPFAFFCPLPFLAPPCLDVCFQNYFCLKSYSTHKNSQCCLRYPPSPPTEMRSSGTGLDVVLHAEKRNCFHNITTKYEYQKRICSAVSCLSYEEMWMLQKSCHRTIIHFDNRDMSGMCPLRICCGKWLSPVWFAMLMSHCWKPVPLSVFSLPTFDSIQQKFQPKS